MVSSPGSASERFPWSQAFYSFGDNRRRCTPVFDFRYVGCRHSQLIVIPTDTVRNQEHPVGEVVRFVSKAEIERMRLIREARAIYDSVFPPADDGEDERDSEK